MTELYPLPLADIKGGITMKCKLCNQEHHKNYQCPEYLEQSLNKIDQEYLAEIKEFSKTLIGVALDICNNQESGNSGTTHYDLHIEEYPRLIEQPCNVIESQLMTFIKRDKRVDDVEINAMGDTDVTIVFKDEYLFHMFFDTHHYVDALNDYLMNVDDSILEKLEMGETTQSDFDITIFGYYHKQKEESQ
jgi:hypothetical protein